MILRSLARAIAQQNWFTVVLELAIVILGIFIGLQVTDWNDDRKAAQMETVYLGILRDDGLAMREDLLGLIARREQRRDTMMLGLRALETCDESGDAVAAVKFAFETYQAGRGVRIADATYNEMVASGSLARISDQSLKRSIADAFSALVQLNANLESFRISIPVVDQVVWKWVSLGVDPDTQRFVADFDMQEICQRKEIRNAVVEMIDIQSDGYVATQDTLMKLQDMLDRLEPGNL